MKRSFTPDIEAHERNKEYPTPTKAKLQGAVEYAEYLTRNNLIHTKQRAFDFFHVPRRSGYKMLAANDNEDSKQEATESARRTTHNSKPEARGTKPKIQPFHIQRMKEIINSENINHRALS